MERQVPRRLEPFAGVFLEAAADDLIEARGKIQRRSKRRRIVPEYRGEEIDIRVPVECPVPGEHLVQRASEREDVCSVI
jgi:hypothetical protein